jgi:N-acetylglucosaminyldiphosphoundecaprenol N-acetyl-beta-D-mannosaminyltransferase
MSIVTTAIPEKNSTVALELQLLENGQNIFPKRVVVDGISIDPFKDRHAFLARLAYEAKKTKKSLFFPLNVHSANMSCKHARLKQLFLKADTVYCDGAGIMLASKLIGNAIIPTRFANADWLFEMFDDLHKKGCTLYYLGGEPGIVEKGLSLYTEHRAEHSLVGIHHGFILNNKTLEQSVIQDINRLKPDVLFIGLGCLLEQYWIEDHFDELDVGVFYPIGASMDYVTGKIPRCPEWLGNFGLEWLFRLSAEPKRLYHRYLVGNTWFLYRILLEVLKKNLLRSEFPQTVKSFCRGYFPVRSLQK